MERSKPYYRAIFCRRDEAPEISEQFGRFRKYLFVDLLRWDLQVSAGVETDQFDAEDTCYVVLWQDDVPVGGFRAIRTDHDYLAREIFPSLATTQTFPQRRDMWEISRFGVLPRPNRLELAKINYALMFRFGYLRNATAFVAIADLTYERFLTSIGIRSARYGPPQALAHDADGTPIPIVAGEIRIADQRGPRFQRLLDHARLVEISDETLVLGRRRFSA